MHHIEKQYVVSGHLVWMAINVDKSFELSNMEVLEMFKKEQNIFFLLQLVIPIGEFNLTDFNPQPNRA